MQQFEPAKTVIQIKPYVQWGPREFRRFILSLALLTGLLALTIFGMIAYGYASFHNLWNGIGSSGLVAFLFLSFLMLAVAGGSFLGLLGAYRNRIDLITIYTFFCAICFALFLGLSIATLVHVPRYFDPSDDSKCTTVDTFQRFQSYAQAAQNSICTACTCYFPNIINDAVYSTAEQAQLASTDAFNFSTTNATNPVNAQECSNWDSSSYLTGAKPMIELQTKMQCTGWCSNTSSLFFRFTNVNNGKPINTCYLEASAWVDYYARIGFILGFALATLFALSLMSSLVYIFGRSNSYVMKYSDTTASNVQQNQPQQELVFMNGPQYSNVQQFTPTPFINCMLPQGNSTAYNIR